MDSEGTQATRMVCERRVGRFLVPHELVMKRPTDVVELLRDKIVIRCELLACQHAYEYIAYSSCFTPVPEGGLPPLYGVSVAVDCIGLVSPGQGLAPSEGFLKGKLPDPPPGRPATAMELARKEEIERAVGRVDSWDERKARHDKLIREETATRSDVYAGDTMVIFDDERARAAKADYSWRTPVDDRNGGR